MSNWWEYAALRFFIGGNAPSRAVWLEEISRPVLFNWRKYMSDWRNNIVPSSAVYSVAKYAVQAYFFGIVFLPTGRACSPTPILGTDRADG